MADGGLTIYKPGPGKGKPPVFLAPADNPPGEVPVFVDRDGKEYPARLYNTLEGNHQFTFPREILQHQDGGTIRYMGKEQEIDSTWHGYSGDFTNKFGRRPGGKGDYNGSPTAGGAGTPGAANAGGGAQEMFPVSGGGFVGSGPGAVPLPLYIDPSSIYQPFQPTDVLGFANETADSNRKQYDRSFTDAEGYAKRLIDAELSSLRAFSTGAQGLQQDLAKQGNNFNRGEISTSNAFNIDEFKSADTANQNELDRIRDKGAPFIRPAIEESVARNRTYASGRLLSTAEDRAFEATARNASADTSFVSGFGSDSAVADKASTLLSAQQRLSLSMQGDTALGNWIAIASKSLVATPQPYTPLIQQPLQSTVAGDIKGQPSVSGSQLVTQQAATLAGLTTISPGQAVQTEVQQNEFGQVLDFNQRVSVYNALLGYSNTLLGQLNSYASSTAGSVQQGVTADYSSAGLGPNGQPISSKNPAASTATPTTINVNNAPPVASQATVTGTSQKLTTDDLYSYYH